MSDFSAIQREYEARIDALSPAQRVARSSAMFSWTCQQLARQITQQHGPLPQEILKWHVALRLYENEPMVKKWIQQRLADVSD